MYAASDDNQGQEYEHGLQISYPSVRYGHALGRNMLIQVKERRGEEKIKETKSRERKAKGTQ